MKSMTCDIKITHGKTCKNSKPPSQIACTRHWNMIHSDLQDEVLAAYNEDKLGKKYWKTLKKCKEIWRVEQR